MKPICVKCQRFYRPKTNGVAFVEAMPKAPGAPPGVQAPEAWRPYKLWSGDLWECRGCGHTLISGVGYRSIADHFEKDFAQQVLKYKSIVQINDC